MNTAYWDHVVTGYLSGPQAAGLEFGEVSLPQAGGIYQIRWQCVCTNTDPFQTIKVTAITDGWRGVSYPVRKQILAQGTAQGYPLELEIVAGPFNAVPGAFNPFAYFVLDTAMIAGDEVSHSIFARYLGGIMPTGPVAQ